MGFIGDIEDLHLGINELFILLSPYYVPGLFGLH
jgi:hypothetical protein